MGSDCRKIFVAATGQHCGKTTMSVALFHLARKEYRRVGFIKPVGQEHLNYKGLLVDKDVALMAQVYGLNSDLRYMSPLVATRNFTRDVLDGKLDPKQLLRKIKASVAKLEKAYDLLIIEGTGHGGVGSVFQLNNATVAAALDAPVFIVTDGGIGSAYDKVALNCALYEKHGARVKTVLVNKLIPGKRDQSLHYLTKAFKRDKISVMGGLNFSPLLANPSWTELAKLFNQPLQGDHAHHDRIIKNFHMGAASTERVLHLLKKDTVIVLPNTRNRLLITLASLFQLDAYKRKIGGVIISGRGDNLPTTDLILQHSKLPYIKVRRPIGEIFDRLNDHVTKLTSEDTDKLEWIQKTFGESMSMQDFDQVV